MAGKQWTRQESVQALYLFFQMPFGRLHHRAPEIVELANDLGRTPSSVAMKLSNFASLDPKITSTGRKGLAGASTQDRNLFSVYYGRWDDLVSAVTSTIAPSEPQPTAEFQHRLRETPLPFRPFEGPSTIDRATAARRGQSFFRNAVLANYDERCCITEIADVRLLNASHIRPWKTDIENRHNPANGLALSATFDRAFDRGLICIDQSLQVRISSQLLRSTSRPTCDYFMPFQGKALRLPSRFEPDLSFLAWHEDHNFVQ